MNYTSIVGDFKYFNLVFLVCYLCAPAQSVFIEENPLQLLGQKSTLYLCTSFCDRMYQKCALVPVTGSTPVSLAYSSGTDFCQNGLNDPANQLNIKVRDGNCFNGAVQPHQWMVLSLLFALILFVLF